MGGYMNVINLSLRKLDFYYVNNTLGSRLRNPINRAENFIL